MKDRIASVASKKLGGYTRSSADSASAKLIQCNLDWLRIDQHLQFELESQGLNMRVWGCTGFGKEPEHILVGTKEALKHTVQFRMPGTWTIRTGVIVCLGMLRFGVSVRLLSAEASSECLG